MHKPGPGDLPLIGRLRAGDTSALEQLFREYADLVVRFTTACTGDRDVAEDITQDIFAWIWANRKRWNPPADLQAYLLTAARNRARNQRRDTVRRDTLVWSVANAEPEWADHRLEREEREQQLHRIVSGLPEVQRLLLILRWEEGLAWERIATILEITEAAARKQHSRLLVVLRKQVKPHSS